MEEITVKKKKNMRAGIRNLDVNEAIEFERELYKPLSIRSTATLLRENFGQCYSVHVGENAILVTRKK